MLAALDMNQWLTWLLIFVRVVALFSSAPIIGSRNVPAQVKVGLSFLVAILLFTVLHPQPVQSPTLLLFVGRVLREMLVGLVMGYAGTLLLTAVQIAGQVLDTQIGFGMVNVLDPQSDTPVPLLGNYYYMLALLAFLSLNGHHWFITSLARSYESVPLSGDLNPQFISYIVDMFARTFGLGLQFSAPALAALGLIDISLAVLSRTVPQLQVFFLGAPLKIAIGTVVIMISLPFYFFVLNQLFARVTPDLAFLLQALGGQ